MDVAFPCSRGGSLLGVSQAGEVACAKILRSHLLASSHLKHEKVVAELLPKDHCSHKNLLPDLADIVGLGGPISLRSGKLVIRMRFRRICN